MPIGTALAAAGSFIATKALPFIAKKAIPALLPSVASAAKAGGKTIAGQLLKQAPKALLGVAKNVGGEVLSKGLPAAFSFGQARKSQGLQNEYKATMDNIFSSAEARLNTERFAGLSVPTRGLEMSLDSTRQLGGDYLQRVAEGSQRGLAQGGRALMVLQEAQQKAGATYDDRLADLQLRQAIGGQQSDVAAAELELGQLAGLQGMAADERRQEAASRMGGIDLLSQLAAGLGKKDIFDGDEEEEVVDAEEEVVAAEEDKIPIFGR